MSLSLAQAAYRLAKLANDGAPNAATSRALILAESALLCAAKQEAERCATSVSPERAAYALAAFDAAHHPTLRHKLLAICLAM